MKKSKLIYNLIALGIIVTFVAVQSCKKKDEDEDDPTQAIGNYDRAAMLTNLANNYIIPAYNTFYYETDSLQVRVNDFNTSPSIASLQTLRAQWITTLMTWQDVGFLEFGPAANISLRSQTNVYPIDTTLIKSNIASGSYNLQLPANFDAKGLQAFDYLLHATGTTDQQIVDYFTNTANAKTYLLDLANELNTNAAYVQGQWTGGYASSFINNNSSNAQGSSVSDVVNEFVYHYEAFIRKGKIGIPSGVFNGISQLPMPGHVECLYYGQSLPFALRSMDALYKYFNGIGYYSGSNGQGLDDYLNFVDAKYGGQSLTSVINNKIATINTKLNGLNDPLSNEVTTNTSAVIDTYQQMQMLVAYLKVDMTSALGVLITYQDNDGD